MGFLDGSLGHRRVVKVPELAGDFWHPTLFFFFFRKGELRKEKYGCSFSGFGWVFPLPVLKLVGTSRYAVNKDKNIERSSHKTRFEGHHAGLVAF